MIGLIICGHGNIATGLHSSVKLIAGDQPDVKTVDFAVDDSIEDLEKKMKAALDELEACEEILILCDLVGGSPYKVAASLTASKPNIAVIGGANLPMVVESALSRVIHPLPELKEQIVQLGKESIQLFELKAPVQVDTEEDGI